MEEDKYFVPDIEDVRIGYEFEYNGHFKHLPPQEWKKIVMDYEFFIKGGGWDNEPMSMYYLPIIKRYTEPENIRVPYLTKEQIEAEGWEIEEFNNRFSTTKAKKENAIFIYHHTNNILDMWIEDDNHVTNLFRGECKSINEFRWICKLLKM